ncbi:DUF4097 family beta strand repeat-containing protein [Actinophytocola sediminis]
MPEFATPEPIEVTVEAVAANVAVIAGDRTDTVVTLAPTDPDNASDVRAAEVATVDYADGRLRIKGPRRGLFTTRSECFDVCVELPAGSTVNADVIVGGCTTEGRLGDCRVKTFDGAITLDETGSLRLNTGRGRITVLHATGRVEVTTGTGEVRLAEIDGVAVVKNLSGITRIGAISGDLRVNATNGDVLVDHAGSAVLAKSTNGSIRINEVVRGTVELDVAAGDLEIGIREGSSAWLDVQAVSGRFVNSMTPSDHPQAGDTVEVRARTKTGDIVVRRSTQDTNDKG